MESGAWIARLRRPIPPPEAIISCQGSDGLLEFKVSIEQVEIWSGVPMAIEGMARRVGRGAGRKRRFTLPGAFEAENEILTIRAPDSAEPVADARAWLNERTGAKRKPQPA